MKYVQKHFLMENLRMLQVFLCALISRGNIELMTH